MVRFGADETDLSFRRKTRESQGAFRLGVKLLRLHRRAPPMIPRPVLIVAHHAGRIQGIVERANPLDILGLRGFVRFRSDIDQHP